MKKVILAAILVLGLGVSGAFAGVDADRSADLNVHGLGKNYNAQLTPWVEVQGPKVGHGGTRYTVSANGAIKAAAIAVYDALTRVIVAVVTPDASWALRDVPKS